MIDLTKFTRYRVHPNGDVTNPRGRTLPKTPTLRLVDDSGIKRLVTRNRLLYSRLFGELKPGDVVLGEFPNLTLREVIDKLDDLTIQAIIRKKSKGMPDSVVARDLMVDIKLVHKYGKTNKRTVTD